MEENARQILGIVQGTFPGLKFDATVNPSYCSAPQSDGEVLSCLWFDATRGRRGRDLVIGDQSFIALKEVCLQTDFFKASADYVSVLQVCTRIYEQYSQQLQSQESLRWYWHGSNSFHLFFECSHCIFCTKRYSWYLDSSSGNIIWSDDVCQQFRGRRTALLVLGNVHLVRLDHTQ